MDGKADFNDNSNTNTASFKNNNNNFNRSILSRNDQASDKLTGDIV